MKNSTDIKTLSVLGLLTAIVVVLQALVRIQFGVFVISTVLIPIVIGGILYGPWAGAWLGLVFGATVLLSGEAAFFMGMNAGGTIVTVLAKGIICGMGSSLLYMMFKTKSQMWAYIVAGVACPVLNTGIFVLFSRFFFFDSIFYIVTTFVGVNFIIELIINIVLNPIIMRLIKVTKMGVR